MKKWILLVSVVFVCSCGSDDSDTGLTAAEQFAEDVTLIQDYLDTNGIAATVHESGIRYVIASEGSGETADTNDLITVAYEGRLLSGDVFDSSEEARFVLRQLVEAWQLTVPLIQEGGSITIYAPSQFGYGPQRVGSIPPNSVLIFDIDLIQIGN